MFDETIADWQSLTKLYGEMGDQELIELDAQIADLTNMAQQVLSDEMRKRGLDRKRPADNALKAAEGAATPFRDRITGTPMIDDDTDESGQPREYTWKTLLCECDERSDVLPIWETLRQAGIECWVEGPRSKYSHDLRNPQVMVVADQLDQAREVLARGIPQAIVDECKAEDPEFEPPACPKCGAEDPVLENAETVNSWLCEECGAQWTDKTSE